MSDRLSALRLFVRVARTRSFSAAGRELGLSQPSASRLVATLEREVGASAGGGIVVRQHGCSI